MKTTSTTKVFAFLQIPHNDYVWERENDGDWVYVEPIPDRSEKPRGILTKQMVA